VRPLLAVLVLLQIGYPLTSGSARAGLVMVTVVTGFVLSVGHAVATRGPRAALVLVVVTCLGGLATEALGVASGFPFGSYDYGDAFGFAVLGVPWVIPLAWTWMAWPAWLAAGAITASRPARVVIAGLGLAAWDLFLDPQMVAERYWTWSGSFTGLPGVPEVPVQNYLGWLFVAVVMMALLSGVSPTRTGDGPMHALYLWTYCSSVLAHAVFLGLAWSALWGGLGMGLVAVPLGVRLWRRRS
jgi:uncharacterized membrane protein